MKRNIVVILCDQLRRDFLPVFGCNAIKTPNIDELANSGVVFSNAITQSPVCAPARATMMTGRYVSDHGVWTNDVPFREGMDMLPLRMKAQGYRTGAFGKLHHFPADDSKGFDRADMFEENRNKKQEGYYAWLKKKHPEVTSMWGGKNENGWFKYPVDDYYERWIADNAIDFIRDAINKNNGPFFSWVSFQGPHTPLDPPEETRDLLDEKNIPPPVDEKFLPAEPVIRYRQIFYSEEEENHAMIHRKSYLRMIANIDNEIGRIMKTLKDINVYENTTFIFSADHGDLCGDYSMYYKGPFPYKAQLEIPMILSNHPALDKNTASDMLTGNIDIGATVLEIAGDKTMFGQSRSMLSMLAGTTPERDVIYSEFCDSMKIAMDKKLRLAYYPFSRDTLLISPDDETKNFAGDPAYGDDLLRLMKHIIDFMVIAKGARIEAADLVPEVQAGLEAKDPHYRKTIPMKFPLNETKMKKLREKGFNADYNNFFFERENESGKP